MAAIEQTGQVVHIGQTEIFDSGFQKRLVVIEYSAGKEGQYTNMLAAYFLKDNTAKLDDVGVGDVVALKCDVRSREYNGKYYTDVTAWHLHVEAVNSQPAAACEPYDATAPEDDGGDLPF